MKTLTELQQLLADVQSLSSRADSAMSRKAAEFAQGAAKIAAGRAQAEYESGYESDERKAMRAFGCASIPELMMVNTGSRKFQNVPPYYKHLVRQLKQDVDVSRIIAQVFHGGARDAIGNDRQSEKGDFVAKCLPILESRYAKQILIPRMKAFGSTVSGGGDEWVPTLMSQNYIEEYQLEHVLESRFETVPMASNPYVQPTQTGLKKARIIAENTQITDTNFTTAALTFSATKLGEFHILPEELNEDSAPNVLAAAREHVIIAQVRAVESAILNGDNDGTHIDSDTQAGAADLAEKAWKGLRRQALANSANGSTTDFANAAATETNARTMRSRMRRFGSMPTDLLWIAGPVVYQQMQDFPSVKTLDVFGPQATVLKCALSAFQGIPIVNSEHMREDLNASGVYDGVTTNRGSLLLVNVARWFVGERRPIRVKLMADLAYHDRMLLASYQRKDFQGFTQGASEVSVSYGYNIAV